MNNAVPFPQADDFEKVVRLTNIDDVEKLKDKQYLRIFLGDLSDRQVDYYLAACRYLGILAEDKSLTPQGEFLRTLRGFDQSVELARMIVSDIVFGTVYLQNKFSGIEMEKTDVVDVMKRFVYFKREPMYKRRASTVIQWVRWISQHES